jgi:hypothetical protein
VSAENRSACHCVLCAHSWALCLEWLSLDLGRTEVSGWATGQNVPLYVHIEVTEEHLLQQKFLKYTVLKNHMFCFLTCSAHPSVGHEHWLNLCVPEHCSCTLDCDTAACPLHILSTYWILLHQTAFIHLFTTVCWSHISLSVKCIQCRTSIKLQSYCGLFFLPLTFLSLLHVRLFLSMPWRCIGVKVKDPLLLNPCARWMWVVNIIPHFLYPQERTMTPSQ